MVEAIAVLSVLGEAHIAIATELHSADSHFEFKTDLSWREKSSGQKSETDTHHTPTPSIQRTLQYDSNAFDPIKKIVKDPGHYYDEAEARYHNKPLENPVAHRLHGTETEEENILSQAVNADVAKVLQGKTDVALDQCETGGGLERYKKGFRSAYSGRGSLFNLNPNSPKADIEETRRLNHRPELIACSKNDLCCQKGALRGSKKLHKKIMKEMVPNFDSNRDKNSEVGFCLSEFQNAVTVVDIFCSAFASTGTEEANLCGFGYFSAYPMRYAGCYSAGTLHAMRAHQKNGRSECIEMWKKLNGIESSQTVTKNSTGESSTGAAAFVEGGVSNSTTKSSGTAAEPYPPKGVSSEAGKI